jgi:hypothetical protein
MKLSSSKSSMNNTSKTIAYLVPEQLGLIYSENKKTLFWRSLVRTYGCIVDIDDYAGQHVDVIMTAPAVHESTIGPVVEDFLHTKEITYDHMQPAAVGAKWNSKLSVDDFKERQMEENDYSILPDFVKNNFGIDVDNARTNHVKQFVSATVLGDNFSANMAYGIETKMFPFPLFSSVRYFTIVHYGKEKKSCAMSPPSTAFNVSVPDGKGVVDFMEIAESFKKVKYGDRVRFWTNKEENVRNKKFSGYVHYPIRKPTFNNLHLFTEQLKRDHIMKAFPPPKEDLRQFYESVNDVLTEIKDAGYKVEIGSFRYPIVRCNVNPERLHEVFARV